MESPVYGVEVSILFAAKRSNIENEHHAFKWIVFEHSNTHGCILQYYKPYLQPYFANFPSPWSCFTAFACSILNYCKLFLNFISNDLPLLLETKIPIDDVLHMCTEDLLLDMCDRQIDYVSPATYMPNATYLPYRRYLVDWMSDVGEQCNLHNTTIHVSILYLDKIFRSREIPRHQWKLMATACISVAAKYEEAEEHCPPIPDLLHLTKLSTAGYNSLTFREGELEFFCCKLTRIFNCNK